MSHRKIIEALKFQPVMFDKDFDKFFTSVIAFNREFEGLSFISDISKRSKLERKKFKLFPTDGTPSGGMGDRRSPLITLL